MEGAARPLQTRRTDDLKVVNHVVVCTVLPFDPLGSPVQAWVYAFRTSEWTPQPMVPPGAVSTITYGDKSTLFGHYTLLVIAVDDTPVLTPQPSMPTGRILQSTHIIRNGV